LKRAVEMDEGWRKMRGWLAAFILGLDFRTAEGFTRLRKADRSVYSSLSHSS